MPEYRAGLTVDVAAADSEPRLGELLDALKEYDGAVEVEADRLVILYSFDSGDLPGLMSGLAAAQPRAYQIGGALLKATGLLPWSTVVGVSIERIAEPGEAS